MADPPGVSAVGEPRWNGGRILFDVADGSERVACTISVGALQDMSGQRRFKPADLLASFAAVRGRIEAIAIGKLRSRPAGATGMIHVWSDDIDDARAAHADNQGEAQHGQGSEAQEPRSEEAESREKGGGGHDVALHAGAAEAADAAAPQLKTAPARG